MPKTIKKSAICEKCKVRQNIKNVYYLHSVVFYIIFTALTIMWKPHCKFV